MKIRLGVLSAQATHILVRMNHFRSFNISLLKKNKTFINCVITSNQYATKPKLQTELDESLSAAIANEEVKPRQHPGVMKTKTCELPERISNAIRITLRDQPLKTLFVQGEALTRYLLARHTPMEGSELKSKIVEIQQSLEAKYEIKSSLNEEEQQGLEQAYNRKMEERLKQKVYSWKPITYNQYKSMQYLIGRSAAEFAVLTKIFSEIKSRMPEFCPQTIFDFGSGVGTVSWAASSLWGNKVQEYFNVDTSGEMNDMASLILREGNENKELPKGVFYRQFLPSSNRIKYDVVVSAYSLLELATSESRLETILHLWNKSQGYLVLVELGTNAGFRVINEARDFILHLTENKDSRKSTAAHVFSPCPHDLPCPRYLTSKTPCNFEVSYFPLSFGSKPEVKRERYSYVVLKKGPRPVDDPQWPRLVSPTLCRSKCAVCRMCQSEGGLEEIIFTASKHGKATYRCAKASNWGDLLPIKIVRSSEANQDCESQ